MNLCQADIDAQAEIAKRETECYLAAKGVAFEELLDEAEEAVERLQEETNQFAIAIPRPDESLAAMLPDLESAHRGMIEAAEKVFAEAKALGLNLSREDRERGSRA